MNPLLLAGIGGALVAAGTWALLLPRLARPSLDELLADPEPPPVGEPSPPERRPGLSTAGISVLAALGLPGKRTRGRLAMCDQNAQDYLVKKAAALMGAVIGPVLLAPLLTLLGIGLTLPLIGWLVFAVVLWLAPDTELRKEAATRATQIRHAVTAVCDLVVISLAGGAGVTGALDDATRASDSWAMGRIRTELAATAIGHEPPSVALRRIGERFQVRAATDLASSLRQAGSDGARVKRSLAAKANTLRTQHLREIEGEANSTTERMSLPLTTLFAGFLLLIGYPALSLIMTTL